MQKNTGLIYYNDIFQKYGGYFDMFDCVRLNEYYNNGRQKIHCNFYYDGKICMTYECFECYDKSNNIFYSFKSKPIFVNDNIIKKCGL